MKQYFLLEKINRLGLTAAFLASVAFMAVWNLPGAGRAAIKAMEQEEAGNRKLWAGIPGALDSFYAF